MCHTWRRIPNDKGVLVSYDLATVKSIHINTDGCLYTIILDTDGSERKDVEEETLFKSVEP